jgi:hypothetical protein
MACDKSALFYVADDQFWLISGVYIVRAFNRKSPMPPVPSHVRALLEQHPWDQTIQQLLYYTLGRIRGRTWRGMRDGALPGGREVEDIVSQAIEDVLSGQRAWDPIQHPDLFVHLQGIIDSRLSHLGVSAENRRMVAEFPPSRSLHGVAVRDGAASCHREPSLQDALLQAEEDQLAEELLQGFAHFLADDPLLQRIVRSIVEGIDKPAAIAVHVGATVEQVYNARRRLQRKWHAYQTTRAQSPLPISGGKHDD